MSNNHAKHGLQCRYVAWNSTTRQQHRYAAWNVVTWPAMPQRGSNIVTRPAFSQRRRQCRNADGNAAARQQNRYAACNVVTWPAMSLRGLQCRYAARIFATQTPMPQRRRQCRSTATESLRGPHFRNTDANAATRPAHASASFLHGLKRLAFAIQCRGAKNAPAFFMTRPARQSSPA